MDVKRALGSRIKELRRKAGMTQEQFAEAVGLVPRHISRIENGVNTPSVEALDRIAGILGVEIKELYNFQHTLDENYLRHDIEEMIKKLDISKLMLAHRVFSALFR